MRNSFAEMTFEELVLKRDELRRKLHELQLKKTIGQISNVLELRTTRRQIAQVLTRIYNFDDSTQIEQDSKQEKQNLGVIKCQ